jgi:hypothetical protein
MIFLGFWGFWFLVGFFLSCASKLKITDGKGNFSILALMVFSFILAVPSSLVHCAFIK